MLTFFALNGETFSVPSLAKGSPTHKDLYGAFFLMHEDDNVVLYVEGREEPLEPDDTPIDSITEIFYLPSSKEYSDEEKTMFMTLYFLSVIVSKCSEYTGTAPELYDALTESEYTDDNQKDDLCENVKSFYDELESGNVPCAINSAYGSYNFFDKTGAVGFAKKLNLDLFVTDTYPPDNDTGYIPENRNIITGCLLVELLPTLFGTITVEWIPCKYYDAESWNISAYDGYEALNTDECKLQLFEGTSKSMNLKEILYSEELSSDEKVDLLKKLYPQT